jgi:hypothetical protein
MFKFSAVLQNRVMFQYAKYAVYLALLNNVYLFLGEELEAAAALNVAVTSFASFFQTFSATIDTAAWLILLLCFELETYVLSDRSLRGITGHIIRLIRSVCLLAIAIACWGYFGEFYNLLAVEPLDPSACRELNGDWSIMIDLDRYESLSLSSCLQGDWVLLSNYDRVAAERDLLQGAVWLAVIDFINSVAWILVVVLLEIEVRRVLATMYRTGSTSGAFYRSKMCLYSTLFGAAVYWGFEGTFLDFWDAVLWLFAFFVIEGNVMSWRAETDSVAD